MSELTSYMILHDLRILHRKAPKCKRYHAWYGMGCPFGLQSKWLAAATGAVNGSKLLRRSWHFEAKTCESFCCTFHLRAKRRCFHHSETFAGRAWSQTLLVTYTTASSCLQLMAFVFCPPLRGLFHRWVLTRPMNSSSLRSFKRHLPCSLTSPQFLYGRCIYIAYHSMAKSFVLFCFVSDNRKHRLKSAIHVGSCVPK